MINSFVCLCKYRYFSETNGGETEIFWEKKCFWAHFINIDVQCVLNHRIIRYATKNKSCEQQREQTIKNFLPKIGILVKYFNINTHNFTNNLHGLLSSHGHIIIYAVVFRRSITQPTTPVNDHSLFPLLNLRILRIPHEIILAQKLYFSETPSKMNFDAKVQPILPDSKYPQGRKEGRI